MSYNEQALIPTRMLLYLPAESIGMKNKLNIDR